jgi:C4-dicarboxylate-specific signal transduction histidine kinase
VVDDDGAGVPADARQLIFTPFHTTKEHGTGLGLAVAAAIVQLHGGSIGVGEGPLGGARFRVSLPPR